MGYKILDVKADIHEDIEELFKEAKDGGEWDEAALGITSFPAMMNIWGQALKTEVLNIVDQHFEKIER